jgi:hypothetical protein
MAHVGGGVIVLHLFQNACGNIHPGVLTIRMGFFIWPRMDRRRLQSVFDSGMKVISQL